MTIKSIWVESVLIVIFYACMYSNPHKETKVRKYNQSCTFTELKRPWCLGSHFSNFIFPFLLILFAMSYYVREIVNSLYYSILKKSSFFFFTWQREILTSVFHLLTWLLTFKFWTTAFNMLGLIAQMGQWTPSKYTQKCSWRFAIWP